MRRIRTDRSFLRQATAVATLVLAGVVWPLAVGASAKPPALSGPQVFGWGFNSPSVFRPTALMCGSPMSRVTA